MEKVEHPIITFMDEEEVAEPWKPFITAQCHKCSHDFEVITDELDLDEEDPFVSCECGNVRPLQIIVRKAKKNKVVSIAIPNGQKTENR